MDEENEINDKLKIKREFINACVKKYRKKIPINNQTDIGSW
jgi:hypothetical protein